MDGKICDVLETRGHLRVATFTIAFRKTMSNMRLAFSTVLILVHRILVLLQCHASTVIHNVTSNLTNMTSVHRIYVSTQFGTSNQTNLEESQIDMRCASSRDKSYLPLTVECDIAIDLIFLRRPSPVYSGEFRTYTWTFDKCQVEVRFRENSPSTRWSSVSRKASTLEQHCTQYFWKMFPMAQETRASGVLHYFGDAGDLELRIGKAKKMPQWLTESVGAIS